MRSPCSALPALVLLACSGAGQSPASPDDASSDGSGTPDVVQTDAGAEAGEASPVDASDAGPPSAACIDEVASPSCTSIASQIAAAVAATPSGAITVSVPACLNEHGAAIPYRELVRVPGATSAPSLSRPIVLSGQPGAEVRGSDIWKQWSMQGSTWVSADSIPAFGPGNGQCLDSSGAACGSSMTPDCLRCTWVEQVFVDGQPRRHVASCTDGTSQATCGATPPVDATTFTLDGSRHVVLAAAGGFDPTGHCVEVSMRPHWVIADSVTSGVTIEGFTMRHAASGGNDGAIHNGLAANKVEGGGQSVGDDANSKRYPNWTVRSNVLSYAHSAGISLAGTNFPSCDWSSGQELVIDGNTITQCGDFGLASSCSQGTTVTHNTFASNGGAAIGGVIDPGFNPGWGAGGFKAAVQNGMVVDRNTSQNNTGTGLWCDIDCFNTTYSNNIVTGNTGAGIFYEISDTAMITGNTVSGNGPSSLCCGVGCAAGTGCSFYSGGQIVASASPNVTISGNTVSGAMGIGILQQYRTDSCDCPPYNPSCCSTGLCSGATPYHNVHDLSIHDNDITETAAGSGQGAVAGLVTDICNGTCAAGTAQAGSACDATYYFDAAAGAMIDYGHDTYHIPACTLSDWAWSNGSIAWTAWNGDGEDTTGTCGP